MKLRSSMIVAILALILGSGCQSSAPAQPPPPPKPDPKVVELFGGPVGTDLLLSPARVEAFRVGDAKPLKSLDELAVTIYPELAGPVALSDASVKLLQASFADASSYLWDMAKGCEFQPGVRFDFIRDDNRLQILVCFSCDELQAWHNGKRAGGEDIDQIRSMLLQAAQQAFPDDAEIKALEP